MSRKLHTCAICARCSCARRCGLLHLGRLDERLAAHLDGVAVAQAYGAALTRQALERPGIGEVFLATVRAIQDHDTDCLDKLLAIAEAAPPSGSGLLSAFGWVSAADLQGIANPLLVAAQPWRREVALAACAMHAVDPGLVLARMFSATTMRVCAHAHCASPADSDDAIWSTPALLRWPTRTSAACSKQRGQVCSSVMTESLMSLEALAVGAGDIDSAPFAALQVFLKVVQPERAQTTIASLAKEPSKIRTLMRSIAIAGDPHYVPWLIAQMEDLNLARLAGEAFQLHHRARPRESRSRPQATRGSGLRPERRSGRRRRRHGRRRQPAVARPFEDCRVVARERHALHLGHEVLHGRGAAATPASCLKF